MLTFSGLFFTLELPFPLAGIDYKARKAEIVGTGDELFSLTHLDDIGRFVAAVLRRPEETKNKIIRVAGDTQSAHSILTLFQKKIGQKFKVSYQNALVMKALLKNAIDHKKYNVYFTNAIPCFTGDGVYPVVWNY
jgi:nucleoside-diphosphate-sugar epimerase